MEDKETKKVIGLMSGTSCDSIDAGLCEVAPDMSVKLIKGINYSYPEHIRAKIFSAFRGEINIKDLCQLNFAIGKCFANAAKILIEEFGKPDFISSHGQTVYHYPYDEKLANAYENFNTSVISYDEMLEIILPHIDAIWLNKYITNKKSTSL